MTRISTITLVVLLAASAATAQFSLSVDQVQIAGSFNATVAGATPNSEYFIAVDTDPGPTTIPELGLTIGLGMSSNLFIFPSSFTDSNGDGTLPFVMTSDPAQAGIQWYTQAFNRDPVSPTMLSVSNVWFSVAHIASAGTGTVTPLTLLDDGSALVPLGFSFDYFGTPYTEVYVNANGNLTFGQPNAAFFVDESVFVGGPPCIAPFWTDLNPEFGGTVEWDTTAAPGTALTVRYNGVFSNLVGGASTCEVTLLAGGHVFMTYGNVDVTEGIAGLSPGGSATTNSIDLSTPGVYGFSPPIGVYEVFTAQSQFDLDNALVSYGWIPGAGYLLMY